MKRSKYSFHDFSAKHTPSATLSHGKSSDYGTCSWISAFSRKAFLFLVPIELQSYKGNVFCLDNEIFIHG